MGTDRPFVLVHVSDPHIGATWISGDPRARLRAAVEAIRPRLGLPDAVVVSGDLAEHGSAEEYALVREQIATLRAPVAVVPGNHDDRSALRRAFDLPGGDADPIHYSLDIGPLRLVMLDSTIPGEDGGELGSEQLSWLDTTLAAAPERPTLLVMHHPPLLTGMTPWDRIGLAESSRVELTRIATRNPQVLAILAGHIHRPTTGSIGGRVAITAPSTYVQARLDLVAEKLVFAEEEPPALAVHTLLDGDLVSHILMP
jgi:3',5'-cyclic-AMP phosphodiesterase